MFPPTEPTRCIPHTLWKGFTAPHLSQEHHHLDLHLLATITQPPHRASPLKVYTCTEPKLLGIHGSQPIQAVYGVLCTKERRCRSQKSLRAGAHTILVYQICIPQRTACHCTGWGIHTLAKVHAVTCKVHKHPHVKTHAIACAILFVHLTMHYLCKHAIPNNVH